jgi:hypothetical protein
MTKEKNEKSKLQQTTVLYKYTGTFPFFYVGSSIDFRLWDDAQAVVNHSLLYT